MHASTPDPMKRLLGIWHRRKWLALLVFAGAAAAAVTVAVSLPGRYRATATVLVEPGQPESFMQADADVRLHAVSQEILSRARLEHLIRQYGLYDAAEEGTSREAAVEQMRKDIKLELKEVDTGGGREMTVAFDLSFLGPDASQAAQVTNSLAAFFVAEDRSLRQRQAAGMVQLLRAQLEEMKPKVEAQQQRLGRFQDDHLGELPEQTMANLATLDRLQTQLRITIDDRLRAMQRREEMQKRLSEAEPPSLADPEMLGARIARLNQELLDLRRRFSDRYPDVVRIQEEIAALESQAAEARNGRAPTTPADQYTQRLRDEAASAAAEIDRLKGQEARLRSEIVVYHKRLENAPRRQRALREVSRDHQSTRELYDTLLRQYEEAQLAASSVPDVRRPRFRVVDPAVPPTETAVPDRLKLALLGLVASLALAAAVVIVAEQRDDRFHSTADVRRFTRVPVLASIPRIVTESDARRRRMRFAAGAALAVLGVTLIIHAARYVAAGNDGLVTVLARGRS